MNTGIHHICLNSTSSDMRCAKNPASSAAQHRQPRSLLEGQCVSLLFFFFLTSPHFVSSQQSKDTSQSVVYHISNESGVIVFFPETAMIQSLALARDQPSVNNVYHCLPRLFNYLANIIDKPATLPVSTTFLVTIHKIYPLDCTSK